MKDDNRSYRNSVQLRICCQNSLSFDPTGPEAESFVFAPKKRSPPRAKIITKKKLSPDICKFDDLECEQIISHNKLNYFGPDILFEEETSKHNDESITETNLKNLEQDEGVISVFLDPNENNLRHTFRMDVWDLLDDPSSSSTAQLLAVWIMVLIVASCVSFIIETDLNYHQQDYLIFTVVEWFCIIQFTVEYALRLAVCPDRIKFMKGWLNAVDLIAILPFWVEFFSNDFGDTAFLRIIRLARIFRVFKISKYVSWVVVFVNAILGAARPLGMVLYVVAIAVIFFSSIVYFVEKGVWNSVTRQYERKTWSSGNVKHTVWERSPFQSIPDTFWWCIVTMTTVGYGDATPLTWAGRFVCGITSLCGIMVFAIPITVISKTFDKELDKMTNEEKLGICNIRKLKHHLVRAYQRNLTEDSKVPNEKLTEAQRNELLIKLMRYLKKEIKHYNWRDLNSISSGDLRSVLNFYVRNQFNVLISHSSNQLEEKIQIAIKSHKDILKDEIGVILDELVDSEFRFYEELDKKMEERRKAIRRLSETASEVRI